MTNTAFVLEVITEMKYIRFESYIFQTIFLILLLFFSFKVIKYHLDYIYQGDEFMKLLVLILNKTECLENLLIKLAEGGIKGATILESTGMMRALGDLEVLNFFGSLRMMLDPHHTSNKTIFIVVEDDHVEIAKNIINEATGGIDHPDTGILIGLPILFSEGVLH